MPSTPRQNRITVDLQEYKEPWLQYCKANETTPSEALRQVAAKLTKSMPPTPKEELAPLGKIRKAIKFTQEEIFGIEAAAQADGFVFNRWIIALVRARLGKGAQLGQPELEALARSNMQVMAVGRNINQIVRELRSNPSLVNDAWLTEVAGVKRLIDEHATTVAKVLEANVRRWSTR